ncbi:MAG: CoA activase [Deltaproteobacteria bacterium]|nr:CoA activase [Deltaproteobacteria bacterium]
MNHLNDLNNKFVIGIDAGSVSINSVVINSSGQVVYESPYHRHLGKIEDAVYDLLTDEFKEFGEDNIKAVAFTGNHGEQISARLGGFYEFETICQVKGAIQINPDVKSIISMGGQDTALFQIGSNNGAWDLDHFNTNGPCASGTGSFIDQQAQRLATSIYDKKMDASGHNIDKILSDFIALGLKSENPSHVACRCTVFTKSDMIHLQNKGESLEDIIYGLHLGNARNYISTIVSNRILEDPIIFIGGLSMNEIQVKAFKQYFPGLFVPEYNTSTGAIGVAIQAMEEGITNRVNPEVLKKQGADNYMNLPTASRLEINKTLFDEDNSIRAVLSGKKIPAYLGLDIGSTTTKYAIINEKGDIIHKAYLHTRGKPIEVTQSLLKIIRDEAEKKIILNGVATTGSGRNVVGDFLNADLIIDEITAHARGAVEIDPYIDTIFEIGGQDAKYISVTNSYPLDFDMNKVCAAGTGSFLHELANKYGINIAGEFQEIALSSEKPIKLAERCTVFMESDLVSYHQRGASMQDLIAGLCYAIVHNYLNRVVGKRKIGNRVMFLGGPSLNKGVVAAFENILGQGLIVPKHREVLGAFGAALKVKEMMEAEENTPTRFRGVENCIHDRMEFTEKICTADPACHNQCKLKIYDFDGRRSVWGGECGRYDVIRSSSKKEANYFKMRDEIWHKYIAGLYDLVSDKPVTEVDGKPTIGIQRTLYTIQTAVLWIHFFDRLGFRPVLTGPTNNHIAEIGIEAMTAETCFPIKVSHGHVRSLAGKTGYLFLPVLINMETEDKNEKGFYCPLVQANKYMVNAALDLDTERIIGPILHMKHDLPSLAIEMAEQMSPALNKSPSEIKEALYYGMKRHKAFLAEIHNTGSEILSAHDPEEPLIIVTGRPYNLYDERLNLRLGQNFSKIGLKALPMDYIDVTGIDLSDFPNMYWGYGGQILRTAKFIKAHSNFFGLHLTNFSCGADSFVEHFYKHVMGDKPSLILELDEHSAVAGVMTRLEAYRNVIENIMLKLRKQPRQRLRLAN